MPRDAVPKNDKSLGRIGHDTFWDTSLRSRSALYRMTAGSGTYTSSRLADSESSANVGLVVVGGVGGG